MDIRIGIDIVELSRINKTNMNNLANKILTKKEYITYLKYVGKRRIEYLGGRFAAKEAIYKAIGNIDVDLQDIEVLNDKNGKPFSHYRNYLISISISHSEFNAIAIALINN